MRLIFSNLIRNHSKQASFALMLLAGSSTWGILPSFLAMPFIIGSAACLGSNIIYEALFGMAVEALELRVSQFSQSDYKRSLEEDDYPDQLEAGQDKFSD